MPQQSWSVGILCYNEVHTIRQVVEKAREVLGRIAAEYEVLIVDDGSTDGSAEIAEALGKEYRDVVPVIHGVNKGIGHGLRSVYENARFENVMATAGDGQFDLEEIVPVGTVPDHTIISFYRKVNTTYGLYRNILSLFNKKLNEWLVGMTLKDVNWTKIYRRDDLKRITMELESSLVESEVVAKLQCLGVKVIEIESKYLPRTHGVSKGSSWKIVKKALRDTFLLSKIMRRFRKEVRIKK